jgi:hypothetical protein
MDLRSNANVEMCTRLIQGAELTFENGLNYPKELFCSLIALTQHQPMKIENGSSIPSTMTNLDIYRSHNIP